MISWLTMITPAWLPSARHSHAWNEWLRTTIDIKEPPFHPTHHIYDRARRRADGRRSHETGRIGLHAKAYQPTKFTRKNRLSYEL
jgi:hypothetical protein